MSGLQPSVSWSSLECLETALSYGLSWVSWSFRPNGHTQTTLPVSKDRFFFKCQILKKKIWVRNEKMALGGGERTPPCDSKWPLGLCNAWPLTFLFEFNIVWMCYYVLLVDGQGCKLPDTCGYPACRYPDFRNLASTRIRPEPEATQSANFDQIKYGSFSSKFL